MDRAKVLVIDDDPVCTGVLLAMLGDDYQVTTANSGIGGIEILKSMTPDLVLLDITMPEVNGYHVLKHLKKDSAKSNIPIIVISTLIEEYDKEFALKLGANDYIDKPVLPNILQSKIEKYLG